MANLTRWTPREVLRLPVGIGSKIGAADNTSLMGGSHSYGAPLFVLWAFGFWASFAIVIAMKSFTSAYMGRDYMAIWGRFTLPTVICGFFFGYLFTGMLGGYHEIGFSLPIFVIGFILMWIYRHKQSGEYPQSCFSAYSGSPYEMWNGLRAVPVLSGFANLVQSIPEKPMQLIVEPALWFIIGHFIGNYDNYALGAYIQFGVWVMVAFRLLEWQRIRSIYRKLDSSGAAGHAKAMVGTAGCYVNNGFPLQLDNFSWRDLLPSFKGIFKKPEPELPEAERPNLRPSYKEMLELLHPELRALLEVPAEMATEVVASVENAVDAAIETTIDSGEQEVIENAT